MRGALVEHAGAMKRLAGSLSLALCMSFAVGCDSGEKKDDKKADAKKGDDKKADEKAGDAKAEDAKAEEAKPAEPVKLAALSLEDIGVDVSIQAPEGSKAAEEFGAYSVTSGETFALQINGGPADLAARKTEIEGNTVNKLKKFVTENETTLVYETEVMGKSEFHFVSNVEADGAKYNCEDKKGQAFSQADVEAMVAACASMTAI